MMRSLKLGFDIIILKLYINVDTWKWPNGHYAQTKAKLSIRFFMVMKMKAHCFLKIKLVLFQ